MLFRSSVCGATSTSPGSRSVGSVGSRITRARPVATPPDPATPVSTVPLVAFGAWEGSILEAPRGAGGFGYDPLFAVADGRTAAELPDVEKHAQSHRGQALRAFLKAWQAHA